MKDTPTKDVDPGGIAKERLEELFAMPLFAELGEESSRDALSYELRLLFRAERIPEGSPQRASYVRFAGFDEGSALVNQGDRTTELFVLLNGTAIERHGEPNEGVEIVGRYQAGEWFGDVSALSQQPSATSVVAESACEVVALDARLFTLLYNEDEEFKQRIDDRYRERSLLVHLRTAPLFASVSNEELTGLEERVAFETFEAGDTLAEAGAEADSFYLVRSGGVQCSREREDGRLGVVSYYMANSSFGEHALVTHDARWPATYEALARTDVVRIPRDVFEGLIESNPRAHRVLTHTANLIVGEDDESLDRLYAASGGTSRKQRIAADEIEVMVHKQSVKGGEALVINKHKCIRCNVCVESCVAVHDDGIPRISKVGTKVATDDVLITSCYSCDIPSCMLACNYGAIRRDSQGLVRFVLDNCVGCASCIDACPYGVIRMAEPKPPAPQRTAGGFLSGLPFFRSLFGPKESPREAQVPDEELSVVNVGGETLTVEGKAIKCDLCRGLPFEACVYNCPTEAIRRRRPGDLFRS